MTLQEAFDKIWAHAHTPGVQKSMVLDHDDDERCLYRGPNGCKCFIGVLIPDELYDPRMDEFDSNRRPPFFEVLCTIGLDDFYGAATDLQEIHDTYEIKDWDRQLRSFAQDHSLTIPEGV